MSETPAAERRRDGVDFGVFVPQLVDSYDELRDTALLAERVGFDQFWLFDHLYGPSLPDIPALEGWTAATALLAQTTTLRVGHMVLCNNFRHPALLAKMAVTLDVISDGRLELGLGSGSNQHEHDEAGLAWGRMSERSGRLAEALEIITTMFSSEECNFRGVHYTVSSLPNRPLPVQPGGPPIHVGGVGPRFTLPLVARYADVWNVPTYALADWRSSSEALDVECEKVGRDPASIRRSHQSVLAVASEADLAETRELVARRFQPAEGFGLDHAFVGTPSTVVDLIGERMEQGVDAFVFLVSPRAARETIELFGAEVLPHFRT